MKIGDKVLVSGEFVGKSADDNKLLVKFSEDGTNCEIDKRRIKIVDQRPVLAVVVDGGCIRDVVSFNLNPNVDVIIVDYDVTEVDGPDLVSIPQGGFPAALARVRQENIELAGIDLIPAVEHVFGKDCGRAYV